MVILLIGVWCCSRAQIITTFAGLGSSVADGVPATDAAVSLGAQVAVDKYGNIYLTDVSRHRVRKIDPTTNLISTIAGIGVSGYSGDGGPATNAKLNQPNAISVDTFGNLYIADSHNFRIRQVDAITGIITTFMGNGVLGVNGDGGPATAAETYTGFTIWDRNGNMYAI